MDDLDEDRQRVGDQQGADSSASNDEQFRRLHQHAELAVLHEVTADDGTDDENHSNDCEHVDLTMSLGNIVAPAGLPRLDEVLIGRAGQSFAAPAADGLK